VCKFVRCYSSGKHIRAFGRGENRKRRRRKEAVVVGVKEEEGKKR